MEAHLLKGLWSEQMKHGGPIHSWEEWEELVPKGYNVLIKTAATERVITYSDLGRQIGLLWFPDNEWWPRKIGWICWACSVYEHRRGRPLISALVVNRDTNKPGRGFWGLPGIPDHLYSDAAQWDTTPEQLDSERDAFWVGELKRTYQVWQQRTV